jgi:ParB/RepB/Spo0J family partition protein
MLKMMALDRIEPNKFNPNVMSAEEFENLKADMKAAGPEHDYAIESIIVSPKCVFYSDPSLPADIFVIVDGFNRWSSAKEIGWDSIPYESRNVTEDVAKAINYRRNKERGNIDSLKEAELFKSELDKGLKQEEIAGKYNVSRSYVASRLQLLKLDEKVVEAFREPKKFFKESVLERFKQEQERFEKADEDQRIYVSEPEEPTEEDFVPHGTISPSHLEALASLPKEKQADVAIEVMRQDMSVRKTEQVAKRENERIAREKRFKAALTKAKRKKCPRCSADPEDFAYNDETKFKCSKCYERWDFMKSKKEVDAEEKAEQIGHEKKASEERTERFKEARENPSYIRTPETPAELHKKVWPWVLRKVKELTEISRVSIYGKRGDEVMQIDYDPPSGFTRMKLSIQIEDKTFSFDVEAKDYKKVDAKARVNLGWLLKPSEETRKELRRFFSEVVETNEDPVLVKR